MNGNTVTDYEFLIAYNSLDNVLKLAAASAQVQAMREDLSLEADCYRNEAPTEQAKTLAPVRRAA